MAKSRRRSFFPVKIPINSLSGGVGTQVPTKRLPNEVSAMENVFCTPERSIDKRNGLINCTGAGADLGIEYSDHCWFYWLSLGTDLTYLVSINTGHNINSTVLKVAKLVDHGGEAPEFVEQNIDPAFLHPEQGGTPTTELTPAELKIREYLTKNQPGKKGIRACSIGTSVLVLNTTVKAGFTSTKGDDGKWYLYDMDGNQLAAEDVLGKPIEYQSSTTVDPKGRAQVHTGFTDYVWGETAIDTTKRMSDVPSSENYNRYGIYKVKNSLAADELPGPTQSENTDAPSVATSKWEEDLDDDGNHRFTKYIPVEDYIYPDVTELWRGQSVTKFSDLKFPPEDTALTARPGDDATKAVIAQLYPDEGDATGAGEIIYLSESYLDASPGWYTVINTTSRPYLARVRTPDGLGLIDKNRMPVQVFYDDENSRWSIRQVDWDARESGTKDNNSGPSFFTDSNGKAKQVEIKAISFYRDRLFLASNDTLVSSKLGDFDNFFLNDPANITFRDPIDVEVSSNVYTPITYLQPFKDFLFLGTAGNTQYELMGSENQISPLTAEIAPTSFFPMSTSVEPVVMNNNLYFFAKNRLYIYFPSFEATAQQAFELSTHVPAFLADDFYTVAVSTAQNMIFAVEGSQPSNSVIVYRNQMAGEQVVQNAFWKFIFNGGVGIHDIHTIDDDVYFVVSEHKGDYSMAYSVKKMSLHPDRLDRPRLDSRSNVTLYDHVYDSTTNKTTAKINAPSILRWDQIIGSSGIFNKVPIDVTVNGDEVTMDGNKTELLSGIMGIKYLAKVELSETFVRDDKNNIIPGTLNLRYGITRHHNSGIYDIKVTRKGRTTKVSSFHPYVTDESSTVSSSLYPINLDRDDIEKDGVHKFPLMGFSNDLKVVIESNYHLPMNITNIELTGKFKRVSHFITT